MQSSTRRSYQAFVLVALAGLAACGKDSNPAGPTIPATVTAPPAPVTRVVREGSFTGLASGFVLPIVFTTSSVGTLEAVVDWTFASNDLDLGLVRGDIPCTVEDINARTCPFLAVTNSPTSKPERLNAGSQAAGTFTLYIANFGSSSESLSYLIQLTSTAGTSSLARTHSQAAGLDTPRKARLAGLATP